MDGSCCPICRSIATLTIVKVGDEVALQYYRLERVFSGAINMKDGDAQYVKSPTRRGHR